MSSGEWNPEIAKAAVPAVGYFEQVLEDRKSENWGWQNEISWSPGWREAIQRGGNMPGESHVKTIEADPTQLERKGATL